MGGLIICEVFVPSVSRASTHSMCPHIRFVLPSKLWGNTGALTAISEEQHRQVVGVRFSLYRFFSVLGVRTHEVGRHLRGRERRRCLQTLLVFLGMMFALMQCIILEGLAKSCREGRVRCVEREEGRSQLFEFDES